MKLPIEEMRQQNEKSMRQAESDVYMWGVGFTSIDIDGNAVCYRPWQVTINTEASEEEWKNAECSS